MNYQKNKPFNDLPSLPPKIELETTKIMRKAILANKALSKLVGSSQQLPDESILINSITIQEAKLSSEVENIITTNDALYEAMVADDKIVEPETKEVLHYKDALFEGYKFVVNNKMLTANLFVRLVNIIKENDAGIRKLSGTNIKNKQTDEVIYTPPEGEQIIRNKLSDLERYLNEESEIDPLIRMALLHYQFEAIHPFYDGNGRTGRILNILFLVKNNLLELPIIYLSRYIIDNKTKYYEKIKNVTEKGEWQEWVWFILDAIEQTSKYTLDKINTICKLMEETNEIVKVDAPDIYSKQLIEELFRLPYCKRKFLEKANIAKKQTAGKYLKKLENMKVLRSVKVGREKLYINTKFFDLLSK
jgi:Fic family protein